MKLEPVEYHCSKKTNSRLCNHAKNANVKLDLEITVER